MIHPRRRPGVILGVAIATIAACTSTPPPPTLTPSATPGRPAASDVPTTPSGPGDAAWTLVARGNAADAVQFRAVIPVADGFVVTGSTGQAGESPIALHSTDGTAWSPEPIEGSGIAPSLLIRWNDGLLAVGAGETSRCAHPFGMATWTRASDASWAASGFDPDLCAGGNPSAVILDGRPWLVGSGTADVPYLMDSDDGLTWADHRERLGDVFVGSAVVDGSGMWVFARATADGSALVLRSPDAVHWTTMPLRDAAGDPVDVIAANVVGDRVVVLVTRNGTVGRMTAKAADGWDESAVAGFPSGSIASVAVVGGFLVAIDSHDDGTSGLWSSADGTSWRAVPPPSEAGPGSTLWAVAIGNGTAVLVGQVEAPDGSVAVGAIWSAPAAILAP